MIKFLSLAFISLVGFQAHAVSTPCRGEYLPIGQSRMAQNIRLLCGGGASNFVRTHNKVDPETFKQWTKLEKLGQREEMQALRLKEAEIAWKGEINYQTAVAWDWYSAEEGYNEQRCGSRQEPYKCKESVYETVCEDDSSSSSSSSGGGLRDYSTGGTGVRGESASDIPSARRRTPNGCRQVKTGERDATCYKKVANFCKWNELHQEVRHCSNEKMTYDARFSKPRASDWSPANPNYMDILPNKYDLLPGEWETITVVSNFGQGTSIRPQIVIDNAWNKYSDRLSIQSTACRVDNPLHLSVEIDTLGRIVRKTPNTFAAGVDAKGRPMKMLYRNEVAIKDGVAEGEPYEVRLSDESNELISIAARQSRNLSELSDPNNVTTVQQQKIKGVAGLPESFWKDTQFRLRLTKVQKFGRDIRIAQNVYTNAGMVMTDTDNMIIPLDGRNGVDSLFQATGPFNFALKSFWEKTRIELTPGATYELGLSMYQRGLPFYESGCAEGQSCEGEKANNRAFSDEMIIKFTADKRVDQRSWFQKFIDWQAGR